MQQPAVQFCTTSDGVSIAFWEAGEGPPLIYLPPLPQHAQLDWQIADMRRLYEWLAAKHRLIRLDRRNTGLSQRGVEDVSAEASLLDVDAVADRLQLEPFDLMAAGTAGALAIQYAATRPERVRHLVLNNAVFRLPDVELPPALQALTAVLEYDWESYTEMVAGLVWGWADERRPRYAELLRASATWEDVRRGRLPTTPQFLEQVTAPTLVVHHRDAIATTVDMGRRLATAIPNARLITLEGRAVGGGLSDPRTLAAVDAFLAEDAPPSSEREIPSGTAIILFADIADSTALTERLGDAAFRENARELDTTLREIIRSRAGTPIEGKLLGDGVLATFASAKDAIDAAMDVARHGDDAGLPLHAGIHAGDVIREDDAYGRGNVFGGTVNIASRISGLAAPGEVLISQTVRDLARTSAGVSFDDRGEQSLKGVGEAVRVFAVGLSTSSRLGE